MTQGVTMPLSGFLVRWTGPRPAMFAGCAIFSLGTGLTYFTLQMVIVVNNFFRDIRTISLWRVFLGWLSPMGSSRPAGRASHSFPPWPSAWDGFQIIRWIFFYKFGGMLLISYFDFVTCRALQWELWSVVLVAGLSSSTRYRWTITKKLCLIAKIIWVFFQTAILNPNNISTEGLYFEDPDLLGSHFTLLCFIKCKTWYFW